MSETPEEPSAPDLTGPAAQSDAVVEPALPATSARTRGPVEKPRGILFVIVLSIVTLGIYHLYWYYKSFEEMKRHTGNGIGGILGLLIAIVFNPINWFVMPSEIGNMYRGDRRPAPMTGWTGLTRVDRDEGD